MIKTLKIDVVGGDPAALSAQVDALQTSTRATYNLVVELADRLGVAPSYFELCQMLTQWRAAGVVGQATASVQRGALMQARTACGNHRDHVRQLAARILRDLRQEAVAAAWLATLPPGLEAPASPKECAAWMDGLPEDLAPSRQVSAAVLHKSKKRINPVRPAQDRMRTRKRHESGLERPALFFPQGVRRVDARAVHLPGPIKVRLAKALKPTEIPRAAQIVERTPHPQGPNGGPPCPAAKRRFALHIQVEVPDAAPRPLESGPWCGVDLGIVNTAALSDGRLLHLTADGHRMDRIVASQQRQATLTKGSCAWLKEKTLQRRLWDRMVGRRLNEVRHLACQLTDEFALLAIGDLKLGAMLRSAQGGVSDPGRGVKAKRKLNRRLARAGLGGLRRALAARCAPPQGTSQTCAECGCRDRRNRESQAPFRCVTCCRQAHADRNAAQVILGRTVLELLHEALQAGGWDGRPALPVFDWMREASRDLCGGDWVEDVRVADWVRARQESGRIDNAGMGDAVQRLDATNADMPAEVVLSI